MLNTSQKSRVLLFVAASAVVIAIALGFALTQTRPSGLERISDAIPSPFGAGGSSVAGSLTTIGTKNNIPIVDVTFDVGQSSESVAVDTINFVLTPSDATVVSVGAPLSEAFTPDKRIFGYKYITSDAATERQRKLDTANGVPHTFAELFPGEFFVSDEQLNDGTFISTFASQNNITFVPLSDVTLTANARYIVIANDPDTLFTKSGLVWCGNEVVEGTEQCDDGNTVNTDSCDNLCQTIVAPAVCGNGIVEGDEQCDDGNTDPNDSCDTSCQTVAPPSAVCGNGIVEGTEQCDDANTENTDSCDNACELVSAPF